MNGLEQENGSERTSLLVYNMNSPGFMILEWYYVVTSNLDMVLVESIL